MKYLKNHMISLSLSLFSLFAPIKPVIITTLALVLADLILGIMAARHRKEEITSAGFKKTIIKLFVYEIAIMLAYVTEQYLTGSFIPVSKIVSTFVGITEMKSVAENLNEISNGSLIKSLVSKLNNEEDKFEK